MEHEEALEVRRSPFDALFGPTSPIIFEGTSTVNIVRAKEIIELAQEWLTRSEMGSPGRVSIFTQPNGKETGELLIDFDNPGEVILLERVVAILTIMSGDLQAEDRIPEFLRHLTRLK